MKDKEIIETINDVFKSADCLYTQQEVEQAINQMAYQINHDLAEANPVVLSIMNGGLVFAGQLLTKLTFPLNIDYCHATRYRGKTQGGELHWKALPQYELLDRNVLVVDDILDEGHTLMAILNAIKAQGARSVKTAVLLDKKHDRKANPTYQADYVGIEIPDRYVFGYGMDFNEYLRNAPGIYAVASKDN
ncbi:hypoxanthine-guanine phosphoribosyltransferase [Pleionea litopenaei]|uniref:Hypoxanthine-guanine phosphoribosyltransferase n=1 Tax=Pleionea litopenaei TaxID=3070815 RepID=A0AA51X5V3_9GAMM|nr:hypoxanthine-guanine phosphoribosyltransferase [Pleionea sp. HL-JVS1]WMS86126.1 hypoxanthine-guanine phosphoribosyltransferase [Pleionea sp. HL-JVS1]